MTAAEGMGDTDYGSVGDGYARVRRTDPRIAALVHAALGDARTVVNVGAGAGSYEPADRHVLPVEPSSTMRALRPPHLAPAVRGVAQALPLDDDSVDAAMAMITVHQWPDPVAGLREMRRVARGPVLVLTFDGDELGRLWLMDYVPELRRVEASRYPAIGTIAAELGADTAIHEVPIPLDCVDGFTEAFYGRPEALLDPAVRRAQSAWGFLEPGVEERAVRALAADLASGAWDERYGFHRTRPHFHGAVRLIVGRKPDARYPTPDAGRRTGACRRRRVQRGRPPGSRARSQRSW
ncbi:Methyltransferase domain-containing protein [Streptomyces sp. DvalAA-14]|uniref:class I SAM-dependent methyltransferase n=1 Tax=unclassified Streptomyces TaxID=2593676 RepID=UPI00081B677B|nr:MULTISPECIES: methyltransferase domain-containing protein [unclassified Streptomyces]MYS23352.1 methyltransferase domain-containing protein [Streptomyces sp. SID4948]SCE32011.1 Methyltransferase domain-containing protein [Streptomyces sp. DvalAA-14]